MITLRNIGKINVINEIGDGVGRRVASDFLQNFIIEFAKQATTYINVTYDAPFAYRERQLHSIIAPALSNFTDSFLMEHPIQRKWIRRRKDELNEYTGWLDYWCRYRYMEFFIEVKHDFGSYKSKNIRDTTFEKWDYMINTQLKRIRSEAKSFSENCKGVLLIGLQAITVYENIQYLKEPQSLNDHDTIETIQRTYYNKLRPAPNWSALWLIHPELINKSHWEYKKQKEYYPAVIFLAKVHEAVICD